MRLHYFVLLFPFVLVALYHHISPPRSTCAPPRPEHGRAAARRLRRRQHDAAARGRRAGAAGAAAGAAGAAAGGAPARAAAARAQEAAAAAPIDADHPAPADRAAAVRPPAHAAAAAAVAAPTPLGADEPKSAQQAHRLRDAAPGGAPGGRRRGGAGGGGRRRLAVVPAADAEREEAARRLAELAARPRRRGATRRATCGGARRCRPGAPCPAGRRPYHTILTAQASLYQEWQTKIFYYHFRKAQRHMGPCGEMTGFTRLLASANGQPDGLMDSMPTVTVAQLGHDKTRGFQVINRPWTMDEFLKRPGVGRRAVGGVRVHRRDRPPDHPRDPKPRDAEARRRLLLPVHVARPRRAGRVVKRYFDGDHLSVQPIGPSPAILHVDMPEEADAAVVRSLGRAQGRPRRRPRLRLGARDVGLLASRARASASSTTCGSSSRSSPRRRGTRT